MSLTDHLWRAVAISDRYPPDQLVAASLAQIAQVLTGDDSKAGR